MVLLRGGLAGFVGRGWLLEFARSKGSVTFV